MPKYHNKTVTVVLIYHNLAMSIKHRLLCKMFKLGMLGHYEVSSVNLKIVTLARALELRMV